MKLVSDAAMAILLVTVGLLIGIAVATDTGAENWIKYWDTLVAGLLAVVAAAITVIVMIRVDYAQQRRHEDLLQITIRADRLLIERAATEYPRILRMVAADVREFSNTINAGERDKSILAVKDMIDGLDEMERRLTEKSVEEAKPLFDGPLAFVYQTAMDQVRGARYEAGYLRSALQNEPPYDEQLEHLLKTVPERARLAAFHAESVANGIERTGRAYNVKTRAHRYP